MQNDNKLKPINYDEDLSEFDLTNHFCKDRLTTEICLSDYDWMEYTFRTTFPTKTQGTLDICITYFGCTISEMIVVQSFNSIIRRHKITFSSDIFKRRIIQFMKLHIASWEKTYAFCGEKFAVDFYNEILNNQQAYSIE